MSFQKRDASSSTAVGFGWRFKPFSTKTLKLWRIQPTSSSLNQDRLSAVSTNQYSLAPPFMMLMLLMVSQPLRMT